LSLRTIFRDGIQIVRIPSTALRCRVFGPGIDSGAMANIRNNHESMELDSAEILIFLHIPKTGGITMDHILARNFPGSQCLDLPFEFTDSALLIRPPQKTVDAYNRLPAEQRAKIRCIMGTERGDRGMHLQFGIHAKLDRPARYFTIVRDPIDRAISNFYHNRSQAHLLSHDFIKDMTFEQYLDSGIGIDTSDHQVRMLSGCPELDARWDPEGRPITALPVERRHLDIAKKNIKEHFVAAAPLEEFDTLVLMLRRICGWPFHRVIYKVHNETTGRPRLTECAAAIRRRLEALNPHDLELYEWVKARFSDQVAALGPEFLLERRCFSIINPALQRLERIHSMRTSRRFIQTLWSRS